MEAHVAGNRYEWVYTEEPHATRRSLILAKHPEIKQLMKVDTNFKWIVIGLVLTQILSFYFLQNITSFWTLFLIGYCFGGVINHSLMLAIHEISHNQAFGPSRPLANKLFAIVANLPIGLPISGSFKIYHLSHHKYLGDDLFDPDIPGYLEARLFTTPLTKLLWIILLPFFYSLRPLIKYPKKPTLIEFYNIVTQISFDIIIGQTFGWHIVAYMIGSSFITFGLHPVAGHNISEHIINMFNENKVRGTELENGVYNNDGKLLIPESFSYYGPINLITFNVGYHVEHHDFPSIPGNLLPKVRQIAPEYYNTLYYHTSIFKVFWTFIMNPNVGPFAHVKRPHRFDKDKQK